MSICFSSFPSLETNRLSLRRLCIEDVEEIFTLRTSEIVNRYLDRPKATSAEDAKAFINKINSAIDANHSLFWAICFKEQSKLIGTICLWNFSEEQDKAEIGYELLPQFHGKGIMQEALSSIIDFGFQTLQLINIEAWTRNQNGASKKILERNHFTRNHDLEKKIDSAIEGPDLIIYSLSKDSYLNSGT